MAPFVFLERNAWSLPRFFSSASLTSPGSSLQLLAVRSVSMPTTTPSVFVRTAGTPESLVQILFPPP